MEKMYKRDWTPPSLTSKKFTVDHAAMAATTHQHDVSSAHAKELREVMAARAAARAHLARPFVPSVDDYDLFGRPL